MTAVRKTDYVLNMYPVEGGPLKTISLPGVAMQAFWLPDQSGLLVSISSSFMSPAQIWLQPFPKGNLQRLTNDLDGYSSMSLSGRQRARCRANSRILCDLRRASFRA